MRSQTIQKILSAVGYYRVKTAIKKRIHERSIRRHDERRIRIMQLEINSITHRILPLPNESLNIVVTLTSYGKRVVENAPFAILSILHQTILPNRIVLNLDKNMWNENNIPDLLKKLQIAGVEVHFCEDVGPHTKLLPSLARFTEDLVISVDDDIVYEANLISDLMNGYNDSDKKTIICREARKIEKDADGTYVPYMKSKDAEPGSIAVGSMPFGFRGVLYPPHVFKTKDIFNPIFRKICKNADDIWFGLTEYKEQIKVYCVKSDHITLDFVNTMEQYNPNAETCLYYENSVQGKNDIQYQAVLDYYGL